MELINNFLNGELMKVLWWRGQGTSTLAAVALSLFISACGGGSGGSSDSPTSGVAQPTTINVSASATSVTAGDVGVQLNAQTTAISGAVSWSISPAGVGNLDATTGSQVKYIPPDAGTLLVDTSVTITATAGQLSKSISLNVQRGGAIVLLAGDYFRLIDGPASIARHAFPMNIVVDSKGNTYVVNNGLVIRKITPDGVVSTFAGSYEIAASRDGTGTDARFQNIYRLAIGPDDTLYAADWGQKTIKKITQSGLVTTIYGPEKSVYDDSYDPFSSLVVTKDGEVIFGVSKQSRLSYPNYDIGFLVRIRNGVREYLGGDNVNIHAMTVNPKNGDIYALDSYSRALVKLQINAYTVKSQVVRRLDINIPNMEDAELVINSKGRIFIMVYTSGKVWSVDTDGSLSTYLTSAVTSPQVNLSYQDGTVVTAKFKNFYGMAIDATDNLYLSDLGNASIRKVSPAGIVTTFSGVPYRGGRLGTAADARFSSLTGVGIDPAGNIILSDYQTNAILRLDKSGTVKILTGGNPDWVVADGVGQAAKFNGPMGVYVNSDGSMIVADRRSHVIRKIDAFQNVTTLGKARTSGVRVDGSASVASFDSPTDVVQDKNGNIYVGEVNFIRKISQDGSVTTVAGGGSVPGYPDGLALSAGISQVNGMALDSKGDLIFTDCYSNRIRKLTTNGEVVTLAGSVNNESGNVNANGKSARFSCPREVVFDESENLYIIDYDNEQIRKLTPTGDVSTVVGTPGSVAISTGKLPGSLSGLTGIAYDKNTRSLLVTTVGALFRVVLP